MKSEGFIHNAKANMAKNRVGLKPTAIGQTLKQQGAVVSRQNSISSQSQSKYLRRFIVD